MSNHAEIFLINLFPKFRPKSERKIKNFSDNFAVTIQQSKIIYILL